MPRLVIALIALFLATPVLAAGKVTGGKAHNAPDWFKESFLDLKEDAAEAAGEGKHAMIFFDLAGCPYCARMMAESVKPQRALIEPFFDAIALDVKGSRMVSLDGENELEERELARKLKVRFTPTIVFLDENARPVFRINGFWNPAQFRIALNYVKTKSYKKMKIGAFAKLQKQKPVYNLKAHPQLKTVTDFSKQTGPVLVLFENKACTGCAELHETVLSRKQVTDELKKFTFVRLDTDSTDKIIDFDGKSTTPAKWAETLRLRTAPTFIAFDNKKEIQRVDGTLYSFHFASILGFVSSGFYKKNDNWLAYSGQRTQKILNSGKNVHLGKDKAPAKTN